MFVAPVASVIDSNTSLMQQILVAGGTLAALFGYAQILFVRQRQAMAEARALREDTEVKLHELEREIEATRLERRAAEHQRANAETIAQLSTLQLAEVQRQLDLCHENETQLRQDISVYRSEVTALREQVTELRRIIRARFDERPGNRRHDDPVAEPPDPPV